MRHQAKSIGLISLYVLTALSLLLMAPSVYSQSIPLIANSALKPYGTAEFRRFGFLVYEAQLWAGNNPTEPPIALQLTYKREIAGSKIADASVDQMRALGADEQRLEIWGASMRRIFPNVKPGDQIVGIYRPGSAVFLYNNREIGEVNDPEFARLFFGIWLDPRTSEPKLRERLLLRGAG
ncbi:MAG: chalcone isomerase family protein [Fluviibacter sp.]